MKAGLTSRILRSLTRLSELPFDLLKIDKQMVVPSQFTEWTYEFRAANPTVNLVVPRLPIKASDQYQGE